MLPLLLAGAKSLAKKENPKTKKVNADSLLKKSKSGSDDSKDIKKSSSIVLRSSSAISTKRISTESFIPKKEESVLKDTSKEKKIGFEDFIKELQSINKTLDSIKDVLKNQISNKESESRKSRITSEKLKKKQRESELEKKKPKGKKKEFIKKPSVSFLDAIINFFTNVFLGSLAVFAIENLPSIMGAFSDISKNFNIWTAIKFGILALTNGFRRSLKFFLKIAGKLLSGPAKLIGKTISFAAKQVGKIFKSLGSKVFNLIKGPLKNLLGSGLSNALGGAARGAGSILRRGATRALPRLGAAIAGRTGAQVGKGLGILTGKGLKHFAKIGGIFKRIPVVGALIALGIDLALGVPPDEAVVGAIGGSIGAGIGAGVGSLILPLFGTAAGGFVGGIIGDWLGKELYRWIKPKVSELLPKQEDEEEPVLQAEGGLSGGSRLSGSSGGPTGSVSRPSGGSTPRSTNTGGFTLSSHAKRRIGGDTQFLQLVRSYASKLRINPADLLGLMASESGLNPASDNGRHVGLIQFSSSSAASVGTTQGALKKMTRSQQMPYVYKYLRPKLSGIPGKVTAGHLYTSVFLPAFTKKPANFVVASRDGSLPVGYPESRRWYSSNKGLDLNKDGRITIAELGKRIQDKKKEFGIHGGSVESGLDIPLGPSTPSRDGFDIASFMGSGTESEPPMPLFMADIRGAANQRMSPSSQTPSTPSGPTASVSSARPASSVAPSVSAEPSYQQPQSIVVPIQLPQAQQPQQMPAAAGRAQLVPIGGGLNRGDAYREVLNVSLYKR